MSSISTMRWWRRSVHSRTRRPPAARSASSSAIRDENLVGIMHALKSGNGGEGWGAGKLLADFEAKLWANAKKPEADLGDVKPLHILDTKVSAAWVDYNGHMTEHRYLQVFGDTSDGLLRLIGVDLELCPRRPQLLHGRDPYPEPRRGQARRCALFDLPASVVGREAPASLLDDLQCRNAGKPSQPPSR